MSRCYLFPPLGYIRKAHAELEIPSKKEKREHKHKKKKRKHKDNAMNGDLFLQEDGSLERVRQSGLVDEGFRTANERLSEAKSVLPVASTQDNLKGLQNGIVGEREPSNCALANNSERLEPRRQSCKVNNEGQLFSTKSELLHTDICRENSLHNGYMAMDITRVPQSVQAESATKVLPSSTTQSQRLKAGRPEQRQQLGKLNNEGQVPSTKCKLLHASIHGENMLRNGCMVMDITRSPQSMQIESTTTVLTSSMLASQSKRFKTESSRDNMTSIGYTLASQSKRLKTERSRDNMTSIGSASAICKRAEQGLQARCVESEVFLNGGLSTKCKRLQADNHESKLLPSTVPSSLRKRPQQGLHCLVGEANTEVASNGVQATYRMSLQADRPSNKSLNHGITSERSEPRFQADDSHIKAVRDGTQASNIQGGTAEAKGLSPHLHKAVRDGVQARSVQVGTVKAKEILQRLHEVERDGAQAVSVQVGTVKAEELSQRSHKGFRDGSSVQVGTVKAKDLSQYLCSTNGKLQDKPKHEVKSRSTPITECQADYARAKLASCSARAGKSVQTMQPGNVASNCVRDSAVRSLINISEKAFSGAVCATNGQLLEGDTFANGVSGNGVMESTKGIQGGSVTAQGASHVMGAVSCEGIVLVGHSRHDSMCSGVLDDARLHTDKSQTKILLQSIWSTSEKFDSRFQEDQAKKKTMSNGILAMNYEEFTTDFLPSAVARAVDAEAAKDVTLVTPGGDMERDDELIRLCRDLTQPHSLQVSASADDDDEWLIFSSNQGQAKPAEKWDSQIPQVWADVASLPSVGINVLPYVILS